MIWGPARAWRAIETFRFHRRIDWIGFATDLSVCALDKLFLQVSFVVEVFRFSGDIALSNA